MTQQPTVQSWAEHSPGDRIRFITDKASTGTIVSEAIKSQHGGLRQDVLWHKSGQTTAWNPIFLVPVDFDDEDIPDRISDASGYVYLKATNTLLPPTLKRKVEATLAPNGLATFVFKTTKEDKHDDGKEL